MDEIVLLKPSLEYAEDIMNFRQEVQEADDQDAFAGCSRLEHCDTVEEWLELLESREHVETCPPGGVTSNTYLAVRTSDRRIVGIIDLRHHINHPVLGVWGGHMGYTVRPSERQKGYATEMLRQNLLNCKARKIYRVLITCSPENIASEKTILSNGGVFEKEVYVDGEPVKRYWVELISVRHASTEDMETLKKYDKPVSESELAVSINLQRVYVAELDGQFIGWLRYNMFWDNTPFMNLLYLLKEYRGKGYGKKLVEHWEEDMKALGHKVVMTSTQSDEYAQHFYHKLGYQTIGGFMLGNDPYETILSKKLC